MNLGRQKNIINANLKLERIIPFVFYSLHIFELKFGKEELEKLLRNCPFLQAEEKKERNEKLFEFLRWLIILDDKQQMYIVKLMLAYAPDEKNFLEQITSFAFNMQRADSLKRVAQLEMEHYDRKVKQEKREAQAELEKKLYLEFIQHLQKILSQHLSELNENMLLLQAIVNYHDLIFKYIRKNVQEWIAKALKKMSLTSNFNLQQQLATIEKKFAEFAANNKVLFSEMRDLVNNKVDTIQMIMSEHRESCPEEELLLVDTFLKHMREQSTVLAYASLMQTINKKIIKNTTILQGYMAHTEKRKADLYQEQHNPEYDMRKAMALAYADETEMRQWTNAGLSLVNEIQSVHKQFSKEVKRIIPELAESINQENECCLKIASKLRREREYLVNENDFFNTESNILKYKCSPAPR